MDRCSTGITGLDELMEGGFIRGAMVLLTGAAGTGKTIFGVQYLYNGVMAGENGIYVCVETTPELVKMQADKLGMDLESLEKDGKLVFVELPYDGSRFGFLKTINDEAYRIGAKRIVFDNLSTLSIRLGRYVPLWGNEIDAEANQSAQIAARAIESVDKDKLTNSVIEQLRRIGATTLLITFGGDGMERQVNECASDFLCDGIIQLFNLPKGMKYERSMRIGKMRSTKHSLFIHSFEITEKGIVVRPAE